MVAVNRVFPNQEARVDEDETQEDTPTEGNKLPFVTFGARMFERGYCGFRSTLGLDAEAMPTRLCIIDRHGEEETFFFQQKEEGEPDSWKYHGGEGNNLIILDC